MFVKQAKVEDRNNKKALEVGRSLEIHLENGQRIDGIVDFISLSQGAHNIFVDGSHNLRIQLKIYSNRTLNSLSCLPNTSPTSIGTNLIAFSSVQ